MRNEKRIMHILKRGALKTLVLFVVLSLIAPMAVSAHTLGNDAPMPSYRFYAAHPMPAHLPQPVFFTAQVSNWQSHMLTERPLTHRQEGLDIRGVVPVVENEFPAATLINKHILEDVVSSLITEARRLRARAISFSFDYHPANDIVSVVVYADVITTLPHTLVRSVNFCAFDGRLLSMDEAVGMDITPLAERILAEKIRSNPERYYAALSASIENQAFFVTDDRLEILFDGFNLSTRVGEVDAIRLRFRNIRVITLTPVDYRTDGPYGLKMIPLREMLQYQLGFEVRWDDLEQQVVISRGGVRLIELREGDNEYIVLGTQRRSLEAAPMRFGDSMYVPITFFDQILPLTTYSIDWSGNITFLTYLQNLAEFAE